MREGRITDRREREPGTRHEHDGIGRDHDRNQERKQSKQMGAVAQEAELNEWKK